MKFSVELTGRINKNIKSKVTEIGLEDIGDAVIIIRTNSGESIVQKIDDISSLKVSTSQFKPIELILNDGESEEISPEVV